MVREWSEYKFSEMMDIIGGGTPKTNINEYWNGDIPWLSVKDFNSINKTVYETEKNITRLGLENSSTKMLNKSDIIISARGTVGALAQLGKSMTFNQSCYGLRANEKTENDFLFYLMKHKLESIKQNTHGSVFDTITRDTFNILTAEIPNNKEEQKAIAHILSTLDEKIEINNHINKTLEKMAQTIFKQWFVDFEFPNENGEPYRSSGGEMVESDLGMIPKGWKVGILSDLIDITSGKRPANRLNSNDESFKYPLVGASSIMGYSEDYNFNEPVLVIGRVGTHGVVQRFNRKIWASDNALVIKSKLYEYIYQILNSIDYKAINRGSTQPLITQTDIKNYIILVPNMEILLRYENLIGSLFRLSLSKINENERLSNLRDLLLPKLMSGEIRIPFEQGEPS